MANEILVPRLGWTMEEGTFVEWLKQDGDAVVAGEPLFLLEGEKSTEEIEANDSGVLRLPPGSPRGGEIVRVGQVIAFIVAPGEEAPSLPTAEATASVSSAANDHVVVQPEKTPAVDAMQQRPARARTPLERDGITISPRAARLSAQLGVDWRRVQGSGRTGRIRECDIRAAYQQKRAAEHGREIL